MPGYEASQHSLQRLFRAFPPLQRNLGNLVADSLADPLLDDHFRRSLGEKNYRSLFDNKDKKSEAPTKPRQPTPSSPPPRSPPTSSSPSSSSSPTSSTEVSPGREPRPEELAHQVREAAAAAASAAAAAAAAVAAVDRGHVSDDGDEMDEEDPVKSFHIDMDMEGYTGGERPTSYFCVHIG